MALGIRIQQEGDVYHFEGVMDEHADLRPLIPALSAATKAAPARLNLSKIRSVNSQGVRLFLRFMIELKDTAIELLELQGAALEMVNTFPGTLGVPHRPERVRSIVVRYFCADCDREQGAVLEAPDFSRYHHRFPARLCEKCGAEVEAEAEPRDLLTFLLSPD